jgi:hypothetical protein
MMNKNKFLALMAMEILDCRGSAIKIVMNSRRKLEN